MEPIKIQDYEAVIFDMDGVLIDSEPLWKIAMEEVFHGVGCSLTRKDFQHTVGLRIDEVCEYWYQRTPWETYSPKEVERMIVDKMVELITLNGEPLPGVVDTIEHLNDLGLKIGLATSSYDVLIQTVLKTINLSDQFMFTHSAEHEVFGKPHPAVYLTVAERLKVDPMRCLVIEDSINGVISAKAAKMKVVCIPEKTHHPEPRLVVADHMFDDMNELLNAIRS